eukprot:TRINITY_DN27175_c0_g1_i1.p1 TRINITY_DN27175_c0_g1~~TRINITY_DN27175_c0_g1_i1.p1  ORF type:complete len:403 (+),score=122.46 TRINITY_DN27175_c0_g1_i1:62-1210(+)
MDDDVEEGATETDRLIRHTARLLSEDERLELSRVGDRQYFKYFVGGLFTGPAANVVALCKYGNPWGQPDIAGAASSLGALGGTAVHAAGLYITGIFTFPDVEGTGKVLEIAALFFWAALACQCSVLYIVVHRRHIEIIDPGPAHQIFGIHGFFAAQLLLKKGVLFDPHTLFTRPHPPKLAIRYVTKDEIRVACERVSKVYYTLGVAPCVIAVLVLVVVASTLILWKHVSLTERADFDIADLVAPCVLMGSFFVVHALFCRKADRCLAEMNDSAAMVRKNIAWVMRRTPVTHSYSLWLVWRNPEAYALTRSKGHQWWRRFPVALPSFRRTVRLFLMLEQRLGRGDAAWLPGDLVLYTLSFLAEGDQHKIDKAVLKRRVRAVLL